MKVLIDMNLSPAWEQTLEAAGIEAIHWSQIGICDAPDSDIMAHAASVGMVILTRDLDFGTLLARSRAMGPSVVQIRADKGSPGLIAGQIIAVLLEAESDLEKGAFVSIDVNRTRLRILPLR
jgi:predicted nuclease of predicted toxin-antitoxin system